MGVYGCFAIHLFESVPVRSHIKSTMLDKPKRKQKNKRSQIKVVSPFRIVLLVMIIMFLVGVSLLIYVLAAEPEPQPTLPTIMSLDDTTEIPLYETITQGVITATDEPQS